MDFWRDDGGRLGVDNEAFLVRHPLFFLPEDPVGDLGAKFLDGIVRVQCGRLEILVVRGWWWEGDHAYWLWCTKC